MINWKVRFKQKTFWLALIPAVLILIQVILAPFGITIATEDISMQFIAIINAIFVVLAILGIVVDPTTAGAGDSQQALHYETPRKDDDPYEVGQ